MSCLRDVPHHVVHVDAPVDARGEGAEAAALATHRARDVDVLEVEEEDVGDVAVAGEGRGAGHLALGGDVVPAGGPQLRYPRSLARDNLETELLNSYVHTSRELREGPSFERVLALGFTMQKFQGIVF